MVASAPDWQRYLVLAPAFVIGAGLIAAVLILLGRAFVESVRESGHTRLIVAGLVGLAVFIVILTYLGRGAAQRGRLGRLEDHDRSADRDVVEQPLRVGNVHPDAAVRA